MRSAREISGNLRQPCRASRPTTCAALLTFKYQHSTELGLGQLADFYLFRSQDEKRRSHAFKEENAADYRASALKQRRFFTRQISIIPIRFQSTLAFQVLIEETSRRTAMSKNRCAVTRPNPTIPGHPSVTAVTKQPSYIHYKWRVVPRIS